MALLLALTLVLLPVPGCVPAPVAGPLAAHFAPGSGFGGHWGVDYSAPVGSSVVAIEDGTVTFAGRVVDNRSVTVAHGGGLRTSYSFLASIDVFMGDAIGRGQVVGMAGRPHGTPGFHLSLRLGDRYLDPSRMFHCRPDPGPGLRLISETARYPLYAVRRAARNPRRNLRSFSRSPPHGGRSRAPHARPRHRHLHHRG